MRKKIGTGENTNSSGESAVTNEAEFFAVMTERFYESPQSLKKHFPDFYDELKSYTRIIKHLRSS